MLRATGSIVSNRQMDGIRSVISLMERFFLIVSFRLLSQGRACAFGKFVADVASILSILRCHNCLPRDMLRLKTLTDGALSAFGLILALL